VSILTRARNRAQEPRIAAVASDTKDNAQATATLAAPGIGRYIVTGVMASFDTTVAKNLTIVEDVGGTPNTLATFVVYDSVYIDFPTPILVAEETSISAQLAASGGAGNNGYVSIFATTIA
jgi:hypothetical protein